MTDQTVAALHRARTALRTAALDYAVFARRASRPGRRTYRQAGRDAIRRIDAAITYLYAARDALAAAMDEDLTSETAPGATGAVHNPEGNHS